MMRAATFVSRPGVDQEAWRGAGAESGVVYNVTEPQESKYNELLLTWKARLSNAQGRHAVAAEWLALEPIPVGRKRGR